MTHEELVAHCPAEPGAVPDTPWENDLVATVGGKILAFLGDGADGGTSGVTCGRGAAEAAELRLRFPAAVTVAARTGRHGWNTVRLGVTPGPGDDELRELVEASYDAVVAKLPERLRP